jgi:succinyl-CoA synthetase alpha subunit
VVHDVPVFNSVNRAVEETGANTSLVLVPAPFAKDAVFEALDAGVKTVVVITENIPFHDAMEFVNYARFHDAVLIGPNCPGIASPGKTKIGILPGNIFREGDVGVASRSGTLTYEIVNALSEKGFGQSTCVGLGGDPIIGTSFIEALAAFEKDSETKAMVLVGEIGGTAEEDAAEYITENITKPVFAFIAGRTAPPGKRMGHAGAIIARGKGTAASKIQAFEKAGVKLARFPTDIADLIEESC